MVNASPRRAQNIWTDEQRLLLHLLHSEFTFDVQTTSNIFNHVFADELRACGFQDGLRPKVLASQYKDRDRPGRSHHWNRALQSLRNDTPLEKSLQDRIRTAAKAVGTVAPTYATIGDETSRGGRPVKKSSESKYWKGWAIPTADQATRLKEVRKGKGFVEQWHCSNRTRGRSRPRTGTPSAAGADTVDGRVDQTEGDAAVDEDEWETVNEIQETHQPQKSLHPKHGSVPINIKLDMLHSTSVKWNNSHSSINSETLQNIEQSSLVYKHGGQVQRITVDDTNQYDFVICDSSFCKICNPKADDTQNSETEGFPFVHSSDTAIDEKITFFTPMPRPSNGQIQKGYVRRVRFQTPGGIVSCVVRICGYVGCESCTNPWVEEQS